MALAPISTADARRHPGLGVVRATAAGLLLAALCTACADTNESPPTPATSASVATVEPVSVAVETATPQPRAHVVTRGQTLAQLANEYRVPLANLVEWNQIQDPNLVLVGQIVMLEAPLPQSTQVPLRRAPAETEEADPLLEWARDTWKRLPMPDFGITNEGVRNGVTVAFVFLVAGMAVLAAAVVLAVSRSLIRVALRRPTRAEAAAPREPLLVYVGAPAPPTVERAVVPAAPQRTATAREAVPEAAMTAQERTRVEGPLRPSVEPPHVPGPVSDSSDLAEKGRRAPSFGILRSPGSKLVAATAGMRRGTSGLFEGRQRKEDERRREASLQRWWKHGTETLRIGLLDDAERHFLEGLREAEQYGWDDERQLYEEALAHVAERRRAVGVRAAEAPPREPDTTSDVDDDPRG